MTTLSKLILNCLIGAIVCIGGFYVLMYPIAILVLLAVLLLVVFYFVGKLTLDLIS